MAKTSGKAHGGNIAAAVIITVLGLLVLGGVIYYSVLKTNSTPKYFKSDKAAAAEKLYDKIMGYDFENHYPPAPEDVMDAYNDIFLILYGDMIIDDQILRQMVDKQRELYSDELTAAQTAEEQVANLKGNLAELENLGVYCTRVEKKATLSDANDKDSCVVRAILYFKGAEVMYRNYYLAFDNDDKRWKVSNWAQTDENFDLLDAEEE
ncbi:MAG: hypothetical protein LBS62_11335 [Clostridiales bacterium]|jgi:NDP-sugar pyrophosphorylase family protein|nr:hypothetical protein [Clostridiales bacterium]